MRQVVIQLAIVGAAVLIFAQPRAAHAVQAHGQTGAGSTIFQSNCSVCHGEDGGGSDVGKSLHAADLRSRAVQKQSNAALAQFIGEGKGPMPPFKDRLSHQEILDTVQYIRTLRIHNVAQK